MNDRTRWWALLVVCLGALMINLDMTIVNVALPSISGRFGFSPASLVWVVNGYMLTYGGCLLLGGRLGDLFGYRRLFLLGVAVFTIASLGCGLARSQGFLIGARALQGIGGAVISAASLSLMMNVLTGVADRAKAIGISGFVSTGGGSLGFLLGGVLTSALGWHWIFLVNLPIGVLVCAFGVVLLPKDRGQSQMGRLDVSGAVTVTASLMLANYAIVSGAGAQWASGQKLGPLVGAALLLAVFVGIELRSRTPTIPLGLFRLRNVTAAIVIGVLWHVALLSWFFNSALYMQSVLGYSPLKVGLAFLPANLLSGAFSLGLAARLVLRLGIRPPLTVGLILAAIGLALFGRASAVGSLEGDVLPGMVFLAVGGGMATCPLLLAAINDVTPAESGIVSGLVNTTFLMGGAFGLAILASMAAARTSYLLAAGTTPSVALNSGYHVAFFMGAGCAALAALLSATLLRTEQRVTAPDYGDSPLMEE